MLFSTILTVASALAIGAGARYVKRSDGVTISSKRPVARQAASDIVITDAVAALRRQSKSSSASSRRALRRRAFAATSNTTDLTSLETGEEFSTLVTIGTEAFELFWWVVEKDFTCYSTETERETTQAECDFGALYTKSSAFAAISDEEFEIEYGDGEELVGTLGTDTVTVAGITLDTEIAVVSEVLWEGDGVTSGIMGLAYPAITSAYKGSTQEVYNPIFTNMYAKGPIANDYFSLIIERNVSGDSGYLAFGGVPDVPFTQNFTSTPIIITSIEGVPHEKDYYTINIDGISLSGTNLSAAGGSAIEYIVDSGTTLNYVPTTIADEINAAFSPAAEYSEDDGVYIVDCTATAPAVSIDIAGTLFPINALDMILDAGEGQCISGFTDGGSDYSEDIFVLGDTFQKNVVSVFDVGASVMQFASREFYASNDTV